MLTATTTGNSFITTYGRSGQAEALLGSHPAKFIALTSDKSSASGEKYTDKVTLSADALTASHSKDPSVTKQDSVAEQADSSDKKETDKQQLLGTVELTAADQKVVRQLQERDREVKAHEMAHLARAGQYARGGPTYSYQQGPDGRRYAVGGEVAIDVSKERTPEQTLQKMRAVKHAALAPAEPSAADRSVAASATALESQARQELQQEQTDSVQSRSEAQANPANSNPATRTADLRETSHKEDSPPPPQALSVFA